MKNKGTDQTVPLLFAYNTNKYSHDVAHLIDVQFFVSFYRNFVFNTNCVNPELMTTFAMCDPGLYRLLRSLLSDELYHKKTCLRR